MITKNSSDILFVHRGRNENVDYIGNLLAEKDFSFDYRGKNTLVMLIKSFFAFLKLPRANIYLVEGGLCLWPILFKKLFYWEPKVILMAPEPIFNYRRRSSFKNLILKKLFSQIDFILPISKLVAKDMKFYVKKPYVITPRFFNDAQQKEYLSVTPDYSDKNLLLIINRPREAGHTKGLDVALRIFNELYSYDSEFDLYIIGNGTEQLDISNDSIHLEGYQDPKEYFSFCPFIVAPSRYDAFNVGILEASLSGIIPFISSTTGAKEFISKVDSDLIVDHRKPGLFAERILHLYRQKEEQRKGLAEELIKEAQKYDEERFQASFKKAVKEIESYLNVNLEK